MMVKYNLNVDASYAEQNTLLEPNNFIPSWEAGDEEKREVSNALRVLRLNFDQIRQQVMQKDADLELLLVSDHMVTGGLRAGLARTHVTILTVLPCTERR